MFNTSGPDEDIPWTLEDPMWDIGR